MEYSQAKIGLKRKSLRVKKGIKRQKPKTS